jgi:hypothetical protein
MTRNIDWIHNRMASAGAPRPVERSSSKWKKYICVILLGLCVGMAIGTCMLPLYCQEVGEIVEKLEDIANALPDSDMYLNVTSVDPCIVSDTDPCAAELFPNPKCLTAPNYENPCDTAYIQWNIRCYLSTNYNQDCDYSLGTFNYPNLRCPLDSSSARLLR